LFTALVELARNKIILVARKMAEKFPDTKFILILVVFFHANQQLTKIIKLFTAMHVESAAFQYVPQQRLNI